jgi:hypothetical protein
VHVSVLHGVLVLMALSSVSCADEDPPCAELSVDDCDSLRRDRFSAIFLRAERMCIAAPIGVGCQPPHTLCAAPVFLARDSEGIVRTCNEAVQAYRTARPNPRVVSVLRAASADGGSDRVPSHVRDRRELAATAGSLPSLRRDWRHSSLALQWAAVDQAHDQRRAPVRERAGVSAFVAMEPSEGVPPRLRSIEPGMSMGSAHALLESYFFRERRFGGDVVRSYWHSPVGHYDSDVGVVRFRDGRVVETSFTPD